MHEYYTNINIHLVNEKPLKCMANSKRCHAKKVKTPKLKCNNYQLLNTLS